MISRGGRKREWESEELIASSSFAMLTHEFSPLTTQWSSSSSSSALSVTDHRVQTARPSFLTPFFQRVAHLPLPSFSVLHRLHGPLCHSSAHATILCWMDGLYCGAKDCCWVVERTVSLERKLCASLVRAAADSFLFLAQ